MSDKTQVCQEPKLSVGNHFGSRMAFYNADRFKAWQHNVFIGALVNQELIRLQLDGDRVVHEERLLGVLKTRIRDVRQGLEG